jgi:hypothetical protein
MVATEIREHFPIALRVQDALDHHVQPVVQREPGRHVDKGNTQRTRMVPNVQDLASQDVVADDRYASRTRCPDRMSQL